MTAPGHTQENRDAEPDASASAPDSGTPEAASPREHAASDGAAERNGPDGDLAADPSADSAQDIADVLAELESAQEALAGARDEVLRSRAEMENVRRRADQEIAKARKFAVEGFAAEMLQVKDSLDLAANVSLDGVDEPVVRNMHEGLALTRRQLETVFEKFGIVELEPAAGEKLNPDLHQAMSMQESAEVPPGHIVHVVQKGFTLNERLLRPAMVIVARAPAD